MPKLTIEDFRKRGVEKHGNKYDYSLVEYKTLRDRVKIICPMHGVFEQKARKHLEGCGCAICGKEQRRITNEEFINKSKEINGDVYDYSETEFIKYRIKVKVICRIHGPFMIRPFSHVYGVGCPECSKNKRYKHNKMDLEVFIKMGTEIHGQFDYSKSIYIDIDTPLIIICPKHGEFEQRPYLHLKGMGCKICSNKKHTEEIFKEKGTKKHNGKYGYELVKYIDNKTPVKIICPEHGVFEQAPRKHLFGSGCPYCGKMKYTREDFIEMGNKRHNGKYGYDLFKFKNFNTRGEIVCPVHGSFFQSPLNHLRSFGCKECLLNNCSNASQLWLDEQNVKEEYREVALFINKRKFLVDAFDPTTNTIYEYNGKFWHGHPEKYDPEKINPMNKTTFGELYKRTLEREEVIKSAGYNLIVKWGD